MDGGVRRGGTDEVARSKYQTKSFKNLAPLSETPDSFFLVANESKAGNRRVRMTYLFRVLAGAQISVRSSRFPPRHSCCVSRDASTHNGI